MSFFIFTLVVQAIVATTLVTVILMQRSEGGGLGMGGSPGGLMSARGAADFLTRSTKILAIIFVTLSILLATMAATRSKSSIDESLAKTAPAARGGALGGPAEDTGQGQFSGAARSVQQSQATPAPADNSAAPTKR